MICYQDKSATVADMRKLNKIIRKAKEGDSVATFKRIGKLEEIKIIAMGGALFRSVDEKLRSVEGRVICLSDGVNTSPLEWEVRKIPQVYESTKTSKKPELQTWQWIMLFTLPS